MLDIFTKTVTNVFCLFIKWCFVWSYEKACALLLHSFIMLNNIPQSKYFWYKYIFLYIYTIHCFKFCYLDIVQALPQLFKFDVIEGHAQQSNQRGVEIVSHFIWFLWSQSTLAIFVFILIILKLHVLVYLYIVINIWKCYTFTIFVNVCELLTSALFLR